MKFLVVVAVCFVGAFAGVTDEQKAKLREYKAACITETGVDEVVIENIRNGNQVNFDDKLNCFSTCMLKSIGIIKPDGSIDEEVARAKMPQDVPSEKVDNVINMCKLEVGKDDCETGGKILACLIKTGTLSILD